MNIFNRIKSLDTKKQISTKKKEKQVEFLNTVLERARDLISNENNDEIHPVFIFIKQFSDYISIKTAISSFENKQTFPKDYMECIFECRYSKNSSDLIERTFLKEIVGSDIEIYRKHHYRHFPKIMKISLSKIPLIVQPWNSDRVSYNISNVATNKNPFDLKKNGDSPSQHFPADDFIILLTHTPDYAEDTDVSNANLVLAGHTHGGQVSLFKKYSPVKHSIYGNRFLTGWKENSKGTPIIITNGLGTSRVDVRLFTPSEVVLVVLHRVEKQKE